MNHLLVIGSLNVDWSAPVSHLPGKGETVLAGPAVLHCGGKGGNQAYAAARLGGHVTLLGAVGQDDRGDLLLKHLTAAGVDASHVKRTESATGTAWIPVDPWGDNCIIVLPGANRDVTPEYIDEHPQSLEACDTLIMQLEIPLETVRYAAQRARALGKRVILDPAPAIPDLDGHLLACVDIITPNETELALLTGTEDLEKGAQILLSKGVGHVLVTLGDKGVFLMNATGARHFPARPVKAVDATAAGDSFTASLALKLSCGEPLEKAITYAMAVAEIVVTRPGAQESIPGPDELP